MAVRDNAEIRAAIRDEKRVSVAIAKAGLATPGLKLLISTEQGATKDPKATALHKPLGNPALHRARLTAREIQVLRFIALPPRRCCA